MVERATTNRTLVELTSLLASWPRRLRAANLNLEDIFTRNPTSAAANRYRASQALGRWLLEEGQIIVARSSRKKRGRSSPTSESDAGTP